MIAMNKIKAALLPAPVRAGYADAGDFLRVLCVGMIGWYHIWQQSWLNPNLNIAGHTLRLYPVVSCGYMFVDLMLLLSGFLLMLAFFSGRVRHWRDFYVARAARILPSYLLCMAVMLFGFAIPGRLYGSAAQMWKDLLPHLTFTHNLFEQSYRYTHLNGALWTLAVEVQFYLIFPLLAHWFRREPAWTYCGMVALGLLCRIAVLLFIEDATIYVNRLGAMMDVYANGMLAAWIYQRLADRPPRAWAAWLNTVLAVACLALIYRLIDRQSAMRNLTHLGQMLWRFPLSALGGVFLVCGSRSVLLLRRLFSNRVVRFLSGLSFNFYIWHQFLAVQLKKWHIPPYEGVNPNQAGLQPWQNQYTFCCFAGALLVALLITYLVEKPCAKTIKRRFCRKSTASETAGDDAVARVL